MQSHVGVLPFSSEDILVFKGPVLHTDTCAHLVTLLGGTTLLVFVRHAEPRCNTLGR